MIDERMAAIIAQNSIGFVATVTPEGRPAVSPKGTFVQLDSKTIAFSNIRSPGTLKNIQHNPWVEVNFIDIFHRTGCRIKGRARYHEIDSPAYAELAPAFAKWETLKSAMRGFVVISVEEAQFITSPIYDVGAKGDELAAQWLETYTKLLSTSPSDG